jgi:hypothetical protein
MSKRSPNSAGLTYVELLPNAMATLVSSFPYMTLFSEENVLTRVVVCDIMIALS